MLHDFKRPYRTTPDCTGPYQILFIPILFCAVCIVLFYPMTSFVILKMCRFVDRERLYFSDITYLPESGHRKLKSYYIWK